MSDAAEMVKLEIRKGADRSVEIGGLRFVACRRDVDRIDGGVTLYVFGQSSGQNGGEPVELLRFDFFRNKPHYHAPADNQAETAIDAKGDASLDWGIRALTGRAREFVREAGYDEIADGLDTEALEAATPRLTSLFAGLAEPDEISYFEIPRSVFDGLASEAAAR